MFHLGTLLIVLLTTSIWGRALPRALFMVIMAPTIFDAPGSEKEARSWVLLSWVLACPVLMVIAMAGAWIRLLGGHDTAALLFCALPLLSVLPLLAWVRLH